MLRYRHRVVEEDHDPVAGEVLERSRMRGNELTRRRVVFANDVDQLLGLGRLYERGEPAEVEVDDRDLGTMAREELCPLVARDERGHLRREESRELGLLALD